MAINRFLNPSGVTASPPPPAGQAGLAPRNAGVNLSALGRQNFISYAVTPPPRLQRLTIAADYAGPGDYRVIAPSGLNLRSTPNTQQRSLGLLPFGTVVEVLSSAGNGWVQVRLGLRNVAFFVLRGRRPLRALGYMCMSCKEAPGGPWLVPASIPMTSGVGQSLAEHRQIERDVAVSSPFRPASVRAYPLHRTVLRQRPPSPIFITRRKNDEERDRRISRGFFYPVLVAPPALLPGWTGPGVYRALANLNVRAAATSSSLLLQTLLQGENIEVLSLDINGYVQVRAIGNRPGYVCMTCVSGGPWLVRQEGATVGATPFAYGAASQIATPYVPPYVYPGAAVRRYVPRYTFQEPGLVNRPFVPPAPLPAPAPAVRERFSGAGFYRVTKPEGFDLINTIPTGFPQTIHVSQGAQVYITDTVCGGSYSFPGGPPYYGSRCSANYKGWREAFTVPFTWSEHNSFSGWLCFNCDGSWLTRIG